MTGEEQALIALVKSAFRKEKTDLPRNFDWEALVRLAKQQEVAALVYEGAVINGISKELPAMKDLKQIYLKYIMLNARQMSVLKKVTDGFDAAGIDYMPLKGSHLKQLYPRPEMRVMGDADILIRLSQYDAIRPIMEKAGLKEQYETNHELVWENPMLMVELHKRVIPSYNKDYCGYFGDGWNLAIPDHGTCFRMKPEDEFNYIFTHMAKHYRDGGIGCRQILDLWVFRRAYPHMDEDYIRRELKKLCLLEFYENICRVLDVWLGDGQWDEKTLLITQTVLSRGLFGSSESRSLARDVKNTEKTGSARKGKMASFLFVLFPDPLTMSKFYPILRKHFWLTPVFWPVRWLSVLLFQPEKITRRSRLIRTATEETVKDAQQQLDYVGLKFRF